MNRRHVVIERIALSDPEHQRANSGILACFSAVYHDRAQIVRGATMADAHGAPVPLEGRRVAVVALTGFQVFDAETLLPEGGPCVVQCIPVGFDGDAVFCVDGSLGLVARCGLVELHPERRVSSVRSRRSPCPRPTAR